MILAQVLGWSAIVVCPEYRRRRLYKGRGGRKTKGRRAGNGGRETTSEGGNAGKDLREASVAALPALADPKYL
jgi:hypothetical protein